jgi:YaiO family outer membrane protein
MSSPALIVLRFFGIALACLASAGHALAQTPADKPLNLELSAGFQNLSGGYGGWRDLTLRGTWHDINSLPSHVLQGEVSADRRFNQDGSFVGLSDTYTFNDDWYSRLAVGFGDGAFYLPRYRVDATLYKKWLPDRSLVSSVGLGHYKAPDGHTDSSVSLGLVYYFASPWIAEGGVRLNSSNPGAIRTQQQFAALTYGRVKQDLVTARYAWGGEGYQTISASTQLVNFASREASLSWRHWFNPHTGVIVGANRYTNPFYSRSGLNVGIFHDF